MANQIGMGLNDPSQVGQGWQNAMLTGLEMGRQAATRDAFKDYAANPTMEGANAVMQHDPSLGFQLMGMQEKRDAAQLQAQNAETEKQLTARALRGDQEARDALAYWNTDMYLKLDERQKDQVDEMMEAIAQSAFSILQKPPQEQGPALQQVLAGLQAQNVDVSQLNLTGNPEQDLMNALILTGQLDDWERFSQPQNINLQPGGGFYQLDPITGQVTPVVVPNPGGAVPFTPAQDMPRVTSPAEAMNLPPGTQFVDPQGQVRVVPGGASGNAGGNFQQ